MKRSTTDLLIFLFVALCIIIGFSSCCPKITSQETTTTTIDTTEIITRTTEQIRYQDSVAFELRVDSLLAWFNIAMQPDVEFAPVTIHKEKKGAVTTSVNLYRDSLKILRLQISQLTDSLLIDEDIDTSLNIHQFDSTFNRSVVYECDHFPKPFNGAIGHGIIFVLGIIGAGAAIAFFVKK